MACLAATRRKRARRAIERAGEVALVVLNALGTHAHLRLKPGLLSEAARKLGLGVLRDAGRLRRPWEIERQIDRAVMSIVWVKVGLLPSKVLVEALLAS